MNIQSRYLITEDAAQIIGLSRRTLEKWRKLGKGPRYIKVGRKIVKYRREDLADFMDSFQVRTVDSDRP